MEFGAGCQQHPRDAVGGGTTHFWGGGILCQLEDPGSSPLPWMMMSSSAMHTGLPASKPTHVQVALPTPSQGEVSQHGETGKGSVQDLRLMVLPCLPCSHFMVTSVLAHIILRAPGHHGPAGRCPSPAHLAAEFTGKKAMSVQPVPALPGARAASWRT